MKLPSKEWLITQVKKKFWKRVSWLSFISLIAVIGDEYIKEGYPFNPADVTNPFSHEFLFVILALISIISTYISNKKTTVPNKGKIKSNTKELGKGGGMNG